MLLALRVIVARLCLHSFESADSVQLGLGKVKCYLISRKVRVLLLSW